MDCGMCLWINSLSVNRSRPVFVRMEMLPFLIMRKERILTVILLFYAMLFLFLREENTDKK
jgi:hypothetical protein